MNRNKGNGRFFLRSIVLLAVAVIVAAGALFTWWTAQITDRDMRADLLRKTRLLADAIHLKGLAALSGSEADLTSPHYLRLKSQLSGARHAFPDCRFLYLMGRKPDGRLFFFADSEPVGSEDESPPGQLYEEASEVTRRVFLTGRADTDGPASDRWGTWISALVPLTDPRTGGVMAVVGMDVDARDWAWLVVVRGMLFPMSVTAVLVVLVLAAAVVLQWRRRLPPELQSGWLPRHSEAVIAAVAGLVITLFVAYKAYDVQDKARQETFSRLATAKAAGITEAMRDIRGNQLEGLSQFFESSIHVERREFETYARYLTEDPAVQSWQWIPVVPAAARMEREREAFRNGLRDFVIWERNAEGRRTVAKRRDAYYPVFYIEPMSGNEAVLGYDMGSEPKYRAAIETAEKTGLITASDPVASGEGKGTQNRIVVFRPVYGQGGLLEGFAACAVQVEALLMRAVRQQGEEEASVILGLYQFQADGEDIFLASPSPEHALPQDVKTDRGHYSSGAFTVVVPLFAYGKTYAVRAHPAPAFDNLYPVQAGLFSGIAGIMLTSVLALLIGFLGNRRYVLEQQVLRRTAELKESEELFRGLFEHHAAIKLIIDPETGVIIDANNSAEKFYGWPREQLRQMKIQDINTLPPGEVKKEIEKVKRTEQFRFEFRHRLADGSIRDVEVFSSKIKAKGKDFLHSVIHDITERKLAEKALHQEKIFSETVINSLPGLFYLFDERGHLQQWNRNFEIISGYSPEEIEKMHPLDFFREEEKNLVANAIREVFERGESRVEAEFIPKEGRGIPYDLTGLRFILDGTPYLAGVGIDITDRKLAEEEHKVNESRISALLELSRMTDQSDQMLTDFALEKAIELTGSSIGYLAFMNEEETELTMYSWSRQAMEECLVETKPIVYPVETTGLWGEAVRQRKPLITNDYEAPNPLKKGYPSGHVQVIRHMNIPLFDGDRIVLVAGVGNKNDPYGEPDIHQLTLLMDGMWKIIKQKRAEDALRDSEEKYYTTMDNAGDMILLADLDGYLLECNKKAEELLGYPKEELTGMHFTLLHPPEELERTGAAFHEIILKGYTHFKDGIFLRKDGSPVPFDMIGSLVAYGGRLLVQGICSDNTERKQKEDEIKYALSLQKSTIESTADGILVVDTQGRIVSFNQKFLEMWSIPRENLESRDASQALSSMLEQLKAPGNFLSTPEELYADWQAGSLPVLELRDGRYIEPYSQPQEIEDKVLGRVWSFRDITDYKKAEDELKKNEQELQKRVEELEAFYDMAVGRELRMIELKKEIQRLRTELGK